MKDTRFPAKTTRQQSIISAEQEEAERDYRFTGRDIVVLDNTVQHTAIDTRARTVSLRMASIRDYQSAASPMVAVSKALAEADGVVFDHLRVAVVNARHTAQVHKLTAAKSANRIFLSSEPERYVYALGKKKPVTKIPVTVYDDDPRATWGIHATNVLASTYTGKGIRIAILDTGMSMDHPDFKGRKIKSKSFVNQAVEDREGHGSHCAGVAAGNICTDKGFRYGVATKADLYIAKVLKNNGEGEDNSVLAGIEWALENKCRIISLSLGSSVKKGETYYDSYETVAQRALRAGTLIVAAAGNDSLRRRGKVRPVNHPANCPSILAVGAIDQYNQVADFSCGGSRRKGDQVNLAAPGVDIFSSSQKSRYEVLSGTSAATPFVAGMAALLWEKYPRASADAIWLKLVDAARRSRLKKTDVGAGIVFFP
jgi:subtilisin family serine protease